MNEIKTKYNLQCLLNVFCLVSIGAAVFFSWADFYGPISGDEMGYIQKAALLAGYDWNAAFQNVAYYGFGISLIYYIVIKTIGFVTFYPVVKIINVLLLYVLFLETKLFAIRIGISTEKAMISSLWVCLSSQLLFGCQYALPEVMIATCYMGIVLLLHKYESTSSQLTKIIATALMMYTFSLHNRMIGTLGIFVIYIVFLDVENYKKSNDIKQLVLNFSSFIISVCFFYLSYKYVRQVTSIKYFANVNTGNTLAGQINKIGMLLSLQGWIEIFISAVCKLWTFGIAYACIPYIAILYIVKNKLLRDQSYIFIFLLSVFCVQLGINSMYMSVPLRYDITFYTRYSEFAIIPLLIIGLNCVYNNIENKYIWYSCVALVLLCLGVNYSHHTYTSFERSTIYACMVDVLLWKNQNGIVNYVMATNVVALIVLTISRLQKKSLYFLLLCMSIVNITNVQEANQGFKDRMSKVILSATYELRDELLDSNVILSKEDIYTLSDESWNGQYDAVFLQYYFPSHVVKMIDVANYDSKAFDIGDVLIVTKEMEEKYSIELDWTYANNEYYVKVFG